MKRLIISLIVILTICLTSIEAKSEEKIVEIYNGQKKASVKTVCINGYLFVLAVAGGNNGVSIVQVKNYINDRPITCNKGD